MALKLGTAGQIVIGSKVYDKSLEFMKQLELIQFEEGLSPWNSRFALFTDGRQNILLEESNNEENYSGFIYYNDNLKELITQLEELNIKIIENRDDNRLFSAIFVSNDGLAVKIINAPHKGSPNPLKSKSTYKYGNMGEFSLKVDNLDYSCAYWESLGLKVTYKNDEWKFAIATDEILVLGLHSHEMDKNAITYFHPKMGEMVKQLKDKGLEFRTETAYKIKEEDALDATIESPDGQVFYFFTGNV